MATDVTMPRLCDSMEEGTVLKWLVEGGGEVKRGEALVEIETDKANMTYEADTDGTLIEVVAQEGDTLAIGEVIARIGEGGGGAPPGGGGGAAGGRGAGRAGGERAGEREREPEPEPEAEPAPESESEPEPEPAKASTATRERP